MFELIGPWEIFHHCTLINHIFVGLSFGLDCFYCDPEDKGCDDPIAEGRAVSHCDQITGDGPMSRILEEQRSRVDPKKIGYLCATLKVENKNNSGEFKGDIFIFISYNFRWKNIPSYLSNFISQFFLSLHSEFPNRLFRLFLIFFYFIERYWLIFLCWNKSEWINFSALQGFYRTCIVNTTTSEYCSIFKDSFKDENIGTVLECKACNETMCNNLTTTTFKNSSPESFTAVLFYTFLSCFFVIFVIWFRIDSPKFIFSAEKISIFCQ